MNVLTVSKARKGYYIVQLSDQPELLIINMRSLVYFLKKQVGLDEAARASIIHMFEYESSVTINLDHTTRKVS